MEKSPVIAVFFSDLLASTRAALSKRPWDWQAAALTIVLVQIAAARLAITSWVPFLGMVESLGLIATVLGLSMGFSSFMRRQVVWVGIEYGLLLIPIYLLAVVEPTNSLTMDLREILLRLFNSFVLFAQNQPVYDELFFVTLSSCGFWILGLHAGYQLARYRSFLHVAIPSGLMTLLIQIYDPWIAGRVWGLAIYIFIALALLGRLNLLENKTGWQTKRIFLAPDTERDISRSALTFAAIAVFIAWALPAALTSIKPVARAWKSFTSPVTERLSNAVSALESPYGASSVGDFYGKELSLGSETPISDTAVFFVEVDQVEFAPVRYYWRGRVYDQYLNGQWSGTSDIRQTFDPTSNEVQPIDSFIRNEASFTVTMNFPKQELLFAPAEIIWVDHKSRLVTSPAVGALREVTAWLADPALAAGNSYQVRAMIANPTIEELRAAGVEYPKWVMDRYLQIPQKIEPQLRILAESLTKDQITPYDKAQAITAYLRTEIEYTTELTQSPPRSADPLMWVLFEYKKGFCIYYASAEVLMLRSLGIPARMAVGFAQGTFDNQKNRYTVARLNSHAWPEVYFPGIGWVEFEPTGNQDPLNRPLKRIVDTASDTGDNSLITPQLNIAEEPLVPEAPAPTVLKDENTSSPTSTITSFAIRLLYPALLIGFLAVVVYFGQRYSIVDRLPVYLTGRYTKSGRQPPNWLARWSTWAGLTPIERSFHIIDLSLHWLHYSQPAHATAFERAQALKKILPSAQEAIMILAMELETALFTARTGNIARARRAGMKILMETWRARIFNYMDTLNRRSN